MFALFVVLQCIISTALCLTSEELAAFHPRLQDYTDPNTGKKAEVSAWDSGEGYQTIMTNGIPSHNVGIFSYEDASAGTGQFELKEARTELRIYSTPVMRDKPMRCMPINYIGIATSGTLIYNRFPLSPGCADIKEEVEEFDICSGHPSPSNHYHYNFYSPCVQIPVCGKPSPIYGVAIDGIPIYGPINEEGVQLTSQDLDECGGRWGKDGRYKYHVTADPPYFMGCFMGEIRSDSGKDPDNFVCSCPYDDTMFSFSDPPNMSRTPAVCSPSPANGSEPMLCWDEMYLRELPYQIPYKWEHHNREISLIACCPQGFDCGNSCKTEDGNKLLCFMEKKTVKYLTRIAKTSNSPAVRVALVLMVVMSVIVNVWTTH